MSDFCNYRRGIGKLFLDFAIRCMATKYGWEQWRICGLDWELSSLCFVYAKFINIADFSSYSNCIFLYRIFLRLKLFFFFFLYKSHSPIKLQFFSNFLFSRYKPHGASEFSKKPISFTSITLWNFKKKILQYSTVSNPRVLLTVEDCSSKWFVTIKKGTYSLIFFLTFISPHFTAMSFSYQIYFLEIFLISVAIHNAKASDQLLFFPKNKTHKNPSTQNSPSNFS